MKLKLKFEPVLWLTTFYTALGAILLANEQFHMLPASWVRVASFVAGVLGIWFGKRTRNAVTPVAAPKDGTDRPLVPLNH